MCSFRLLMVLIKVHSPDKNSEELSWISLGLHSVSRSCFLPLQEARSVGASVVSPVDIQKVNIFTLFCLFYFFLYPFLLFLSSWILQFLVNNKRPSSINNCGELSCTPFEVVKVVLEACVSADSLTAIIVCSTFFAVTIMYTDMILTVSCTSWFTFMAHFRKQILKLSAVYKVSLHSCLFCNYQGLWLVL